MSETKPAPDTLTLSTVEVQLLLQLLPEYPLVDDNTRLYIEICKELKTHPEDASQKVNALYDRIDDFLKAHREAQQLEKMNAAALALGLRK